ncbi:Crp/Fnr family transcriptional regulator [Rhizobium sp. S163]|uniref:Crp/Fnr family transcriptional regulator n=1 Tax=Rhizobium sp. S163 TaxID=3055039 RepID=UPI0025A947EA|nr:Crp/Fnr family transcriptional regulator [Rhizobium sp. S163]MDM9646571.1 Crp/Fnr family transcriptional regulator [Rhizobium sp. S163]
MSFMTIDRLKVTNHLLKQLPEAAYGALEPHMERVVLPVREFLVVPNRRTEFVYFVESGIASVVTVSANGQSVEVGHLGREAMAGGHVILKADRTPTSTYMQVRGEGIRVPVTAFTKALTASDEAQALFLRFMQYLSIQVAQSALANARYDVPARLARWLLMSHDRIDSDDLPLTHEFLALMLGVRRSGVTDQLHIAEGIGAIKATRGNIRIRDRGKLLEIAGDCYGLPEREYARLVALDEPVI